MKSEYKVINVIFFIFILCIFYYLYKTKIGNGTCTECAGLSALSGKNSSQKKFFSKSFRAGLLKYGQLCCTARLRGLRNSKLAYLDADRSKR